MTSCSDPSDLAPGSCARLNVARVLDAFIICRAWQDMVIAACKVPER